MNEFMHVVFAWMMEHSKLEGLFGAKCTLSVGGCGVCPHPRRLSIRYDNDRRATSSHHSLRNA
jgi:hypothetical protein